MDRISSAPAEDGPRDVNSSSLKWSEQIIYILLKWSLFVHQKRKGVDQENKSKQKGNTMPRKQGEGHY